MLMHELKNKFIEKPILEANDIIIQEVIIDAK